MAFFKNPFLPFGLAPNPIPPQQAALTTQTKLAAQATAGTIPTIALVQSATNASGSTFANSLTVTPSQRVLAGNFLLLFVVNTSTADNVASVGDNLGNVWVKAGNGATNGNCCGSWWYCANTVAGTPTVTATGPTGGNWIWNLHLREYSGLARTSTIDVQASVIDATNQGSHTLATPNTTNANDVVVAGYAGTVSNDNLTPLSSLVNLAQTQGSSALMAGTADKIVSTTGPQSAGFQGSVSDKGALLAIALKAATGVPGAPQNLLLTPKNTEIDLQWDDTATATGYNIYRSQQPGVRGALLATLGGSSGPPHGVQSLPNYPLVFFDDFNTDVAPGQFINSAGQGLAPYTNWGAYATGSADTQGGGYPTKPGSTNSGYDNSVLSVSNSQLHFDCQVNASGRDIAAAPYPKLPGLSDCTLTYGRVEVMIRVQAPAQGWKTAYLWWNKRYDLQVGDPNRLVWPAGGETDYPEGNMLNGIMQANMHWYGASQGSQQDQLNSTTTYTAWHVITQEWTPCSWDFYIDGNKWAHSPKPATPAEPCSIICAEPMRWLMQTETVLTSNSSQRPIAGQHNIVDVEYVAVWSYQPGFTP